MATPEQNGKPVTQEIATITRDIHRTFFGKQYRNEDDTLLTRGGNKGLKIYEELKRDAHTGAVLGKRKLAVTSRAWSIKPASKASKDVDVAQAVTAALEHLRFNRLCKRLLDAVLKGYAVAEVMWEYRDGMWLPGRVVARDPRRFVFNTDGELRMLTREAPLEGEPLPDRKFIVHRYGGDDDTPYGLGVGSMLFWPVLFKRKGITFWLTFADKFGSPTAMGKYPTSAGVPEQKKLLAALAAIAQDTGVIVPEGMVIELLEASRTGSVDTYEKLVRYMDEQISKAVLGETMSTTASAAGMGSGQAEVQDGVRLEVAKDDSDELNETLEDTLIRWIVEYNWGAGVGLPKVDRQFEQPEDLAKRAARDKTITEMGFEPTDEYMLETYGPGWQRKAPAPNPFAMFGQPPGGEPAAAAGTGTDPAATEGNRSADPGEEEDPQFADGKPLQTVAGQRAAHRNSQAQITTAAQALADDWRGLLGDQVARLTAELEQTGDLVAFRERLTTLANEPPPKAVVEALARATFTGQLMGRTAASKPKKTGFVALLKKAIGR